MASGSKRPLLDAEIAAYYEGGREQERLREGAGLLEFVRTQELLARHLPSPPADIIDVGGGSGIHALPLAAAGYAVDLVDPMPLHIEQARAASAAQQKAPLRSARVGDARSLGCRCQRRRAPAAGAAVSPDGAG